MELERYAIVTRILFHTWRAVASQELALMLQGHGEPLPMNTIAYPISLWKILNDEMRAWLELEIDAAWKPLAFLPISETQYICSKDSMAQDGVQSTVLSLLLQHQQEPTNVLYPSEEFGGLVLPIRFMLRLEKSVPIHATLHDEIQAIIGADCPLPSDGLAHPDLTLEEYLVYGKISGSVENCKPALMMHSWFPVCPGGREESLIW